MTPAENHIEDKELLAKYYTHHDNHWLGILLSRYTLLLLGVCMKYLKNEEDAKDAVQQVFLKVIHELPRYKVDYFKSWIYMVTKNYCLMKLREGGGNRVTIDAQDLPDKVADDFSEAAHMEKENGLQRLEEAVKELTPEQRRCIELFYLEKKSYRQITDVTGFTPLQVKSYIQNGKRNLKLLLEGQKNKSS